MSLERPRSIALVHVNGSGSSSRKRSSSSGASTALTEHNRSRQASVLPFPAFDVSVVEAHSNNSSISAKNPVLSLTTALCTTTPIPQQPNNHGSPQSTTPTPSRKRSSRVVDTGTFDPVDIDNNAIPTPWMNTIPTQTQSTRSGGSTPRPSTASRIPISSRKTSTVVVQNPNSSKTAESLDATKHHKRVDSKELAEPKGAADANTSSLSRLNTAVSTTATLIGGGSGGNLLDILKSKRSRKSVLDVGRRESVATNSTNDLNRMESEDQGDATSVMTTRDGKRQKVKRFFGRKKLQD